MTNEQLAVLLRKYSEWLELAMDKLDKELPQDLPRHELVNLIGDSRPGRLVCLDDLDTLRVQMLDDTYILAGEKTR